MDISQYIKEVYDGKPDWFVEECNKVSISQRVQKILDIKEYLNGRHAINQRPNEMFNGKRYETRKITLQYAKTILNFQTSYLLKNPVSLSGDETVVGEYKKVYNKGKFHRIDHSILDKMVKYGEGWEYLYFDEKRNIKSKLINPEEVVPVYNDEGKLIAVIQNYMVDAIDYYVVYTPDTVEKYDNNGGELRLVDRKPNISGLPICYINQNEVSDLYGRSDLEDIISILDNLEDLISKATDGYYKYITGIPVAIGQQLKGDGLPKDVVGGGLTLDDGADFKFVHNQFDHKAFETLYKHLLQSLLDISNTPAVSMNKTDISNLSEVSIQMLFSLADLKASLNAKYLEKGFEKRFEAIRRMLKYKGITFSDDEFDTLSVVFVPSTPKNEKEIIENLEKLQGMGAISLESVVEQIPYIHDKVQELERIKAERNVNMVEDNQSGNNVDDDKKSEL
ncbi:phage portal protein [Fictibacillus gelatini]|uniref:phage portal protein n=1 Tax=Fictibacillus gelatini TaxID=225985 RepID=UPI000429AD0E|nr:phage portal protein [Fictibacillus gelatini]